MRKGFFAILFLAQGILAAEPQLRCEKNWGERTWEGMKFHRYHLRAEDFPPNKTYCFIVESFDGIRTETFSYVANKRGHLILIPPEDFEGDIYAICPAKRGERLTFWMKSADDAYATQLVPFPLEMKSKKGVKLDLELRGEKGDKFFLTAEDLQSYEEIELFLVIQEKRVPLSPGKANELGEFFAMIDLPTDPHGGAAKLILKRKGEEINFPFQWGAPALKIVGACCFEIK
jgi:hypothetical protein